MLLVIRALRPDQIGQDHEKTSAMSICDQSSMQGRSDSVENSSLHLSVVIGLRAWIYSQTRYYGTKYDERPQLLSPAEGAFLD
jgi:hypothetical protein